MKKLIFALALLMSTKANAVIEVREYPDETGFYDHVHCSGETLYEVCPDEFVVEYVFIEKGKPAQIHLPRTDIKAKKLPVNPNVDLKTNYRIY